jgi:hypothetical protein
LHLGSIIYVRIPGGKRVKYTALNSFFAEPGKTYYFRALVFLGVFDPETFIHLEPLDADEGAYLMGSWDVSRSQAK